MNKNKQTALAVSDASAEGNWQEVEEPLAPDFQYVGDGRATYLHFMRNVLCTAGPMAQLTGANV